MATAGRRPLHDWRSPGESDQYRQARDELLDAEVGLRRQIESVASQRRKLPLGGLVPTDYYTFEEWDERSNAPRRVRLSELFEDGKDSLFVYSHMFIPGEEGLPLEQRLSFVHLHHRRDGWIGAAHLAADQLRSRRESPDRAIPGACEIARLAQRTPPFVRQQHVQPRLSR